jgi:hypothetical protein
MSDPRQAKCTKFSCQSLNGDMPVQPSLVKRGNYWCCPKCGASYGSDEAFNTPFHPFDYDNVE